MPRREGIRHATVDYSTIDHLPCVISCSPAILFLFLSFLLSPSPRRDAERGSTPLPAADHQARGKRKRRGVVVSAAGLPELKPWQLLVCISRHLYQRPKSVSGSVKFALCSWQNQRLWSCAAQARHACFKPWRGCATILSEATPCVEEEILSGCQVARDRKKNIEK